MKIIRYAVEDSVIFPDARLFGFVVDGGVCGNLYLTTECKDQRVLLGPQFDILSEDFRNLMRHYVGERRAKTNNS